MNLQLSLPSSNSNISQLSLAPPVWIYLRLPHYMWSDNMKFLGIWNPPQKGSITAAAAGLEFHIFPFTSSHKNFLPHDSLSPSLLDNNRRCRRCLSHFKPRKDMKSSKEAIWIVVVILQSNRFLYGILTNCIILGIDQSRFSCQIMHNLEK